jgi:hypothetical protein
MLTSPPLTVKEIVSPMAAVVASGFGLPFGVNRIGWFTAVSLLAGFGSAIFGSPFNDSFSSR